MKLGEMKAPSLTSCLLCTIAQHASLPEVTLRITSVLLGTREGWVAGVCEEGSAQASHSFSSLP